jgi:hypothetical protein
MPSNFFLLLLSLASDFAYRISSGVLPTERTPSWDVLGGTELRAFVPNFIRLAEPTDGQRSRVVATPFAARAKPLRRSRHVQTTVTQLQRMLHPVKLLEFLIRRASFLFSIYCIIFATCVAPNRTPGGLLKNELTIRHRAPRLARIKGNSVLLQHPLHYGEL